MPDGRNPFFVISETNRPLCFVGVENTDLLSVGREYRLTVFDHRVEDTDEKRKIPCKTGQITALKEEFYSD